MDDTVFMDVAWISRCLEASISVVETAGRRSDGIVLKLCMGRGPQRSLKWTIHERSAGWQDPDIASGLARLQGRRSGFKNGKSRILHHCMQLQKQLLSSSVGQRMAACSAVVLLGRVGSRASATCVAKPSP